jgi:hypothetical protein
MFNSENLEKKWEAVLEHKDCAPIKDRYKKAVVARLLENQEQAQIEERAQSAGFITENDTTTASVQNFDPVLISLVRRAMPNIIAYDVAGVQPMTGPTGLIFAMRSLYKAPSAGTATDGGEALYYGIDGTATGPDTAFSGDQVANDGSALSTSAGEALTDGRASAGSNAGFGEMGFEITKTSVEAKTRALRATYTMEMAQDLKKVHGLDAESELANILSTEILAEINREIVNGIHDAAILGGYQDTGAYDLAVNSDGRWSVEKYKGLIFQLEKEANQIALDTRRGKGNWAIVSSNVASAIAAAGMLDYSPALQADLDVDSTNNLFAGTLNGKMKIYIDPYASGQLVTVGYRGTNPYDAGVFYCPYVPLTMMRAVGENDFQPRIGFKTRYGLRANPFVDNTDTYSGGGFGTEDRFGGTGNNQYFRTFTVSNLLDVDTTPA